MALAPANVLVVTLKGSLEPQLLCVARQQKWMTGCCLSGQELMRQVRTNEVRVLVLQLSGACPMVGEVELIEAMRRGGRPVATIAIAREHSVALESRIRAAGATCYLAMPLDPEELVAAVNTQTARHQLANSGRSGVTPPFVGSARAAPGGSTLKERRPA